MEQKFESRFDSIDGKFDGELDSLDRKFDVKFDVKFDALHTELRGITRLLVGVIITFFTTLIGFGAAILGVLAKGLHWL